MKTFRWTVPEATPSAAELKASEVYEKRKREATGSNYIIGDGFDLSDIDGLSEKERKRIKNELTGKKSALALVVFFLLIGGFFCNLGWGFWEAMDAFESIPYHERKDLPYNGITLVSPLFMGFAYVMAALLSFHRYRRIKTLETLIDKLKTQPGGAINSEAAASSR
jgi:hypothetical protein